MGALALLFGSAAAVAAGSELPPIPDRPAAELFKDVPAPWRDYLIKARDAERISDPLERCLAYPDLPGNLWPEGHARAHCLDHAIRTMPMADAQELLYAGKARELDAYMLRLESEHARKVDPTEEIHYFFGQLFDDEAADAFTAAWLRAAPQSAYANTARAQYYAGAAARARGSKYIAETPPENLRRMAGLYDLAIPLFRKALAAQPRFLPAWIGLLAAAKTDSRAELEEEAFNAANRIDPGCQALAQVRMTYLQPRWGGSYEEMISYAERLKPFQGQRPIIARVVAAPFGHRGDRLLVEGQYTRETMEILDIAVRTGSTEDYLVDAASVALRASDDPWKTVSYLLQQSRFKSEGRATDATIASILAEHEPEMALPYAKRAVDADPRQAGSQYYLAVANRGVGRMDEAEAQYLAAAEDPVYRVTSLDNLVQMWMFDAGLPSRQGAAKAWPFLDRLLKEFPQFGKPWMYRLPVEVILDASANPDLVQAFRKYADRNDPSQAQVLEALEKIRIPKDKPKP